MPIYKKRYRINEKLSLKELRKNPSRKSIIPEIPKLAKTLHFNYQSLWGTIILNKLPIFSKRLNDEETVSAFLSIEAELIVLCTAKYNKSEFRDSDYDSELALLSIAIERAVGNKLGAIDDDLIFEQKAEELKRKYTYWYYKTAYKYKLPTIRITPFILRLIS